MSSDVAISSPRQPESVSINQRRTRGWNGQEMDATVRALLAQMALEEKIALLAGADDWHVRGVPRLGVPGMRVTDCGHGVTLVGEDSSQATCLPTGIGMAATWNVPLMERAGRVLGRESHALGCGLVLGPKINLHRHPLNGRSFETFSEDPWLAGLLGAAVIRGIQREGVGACVKAIAANNQQRAQNHVSSEVDERTLRELYLRAFELAVKHGRPSAIMTSYNKLNGEYASENRRLIRDIVKEEWNFRGLVVSDWGSISSAKVYASGLDLEMPGPGKFFEKDAVLEAMNRGLLSEEEIDDKAGRILRVLLTHASHVQSAPRPELDAVEHRTIALRVAEESIVLLKNDGALLPLDRSRIRRLLVVGPNAAHARLGGGGSASVTPFYSVSPLEGIRNLCPAGTEVRYLEGCSLNGLMETVGEYFSHRDPSGEEIAGLKADFFNTSDPIGEPVATWIVPQVDFSWGWASPGPSVQRGEFSVCFRGFLTPPVTGVYRIGIYAQEGSVRVTFDGTPLVDSWNGRQNVEETYRTFYETCERHFDAGVPVPIEIVYGKKAARAAVRLEWEIPGALDPIAKVAEAAREADVVVVCAGLSNLLEGGGHDRDHMDLPAVQRHLIEAVTGENPRTIVVLFNGGPLRLPWADRVPAILEAWYPGQEGGAALARILFGIADPSGRLPDTIPYELSDHAAMRNYPGDGTKVVYAEGVFIGYRHFDKAGIACHFPFGFGLSYTTFAIGDPVLSQNTFSESESVTVSVKVRNSGKRRGKEVVQLYIRPLQSDVSRPDKELRGFEKVELSPGEEIEVSFAIDSESIAVYDLSRSAWVSPRGPYEVLVGPHSRSLRGTRLEFVQQQFTTDFIMSTVVSRQTKPAKKKRDAEGHAAHTQTASTSGMPGKMKRPIKLTMLGAGSGFTSRLVGDVLQIAGDQGGVIALVDIDLGKLRMMKRVVELLFEKLGKKNWKVVASPDRRKVMGGSHYVVNCIEVSGLKCVSFDNAIPAKYGVDQCIGDTIGPGGLFKALRTVPVWIEVLQDVERLCPDAAVLNYTNPMSMMCLAAARTSSAKVVGLCHSVQGTSQLLAKRAGVPLEEMEWECAGINHLAWFTKLAHGGRDLYPTLFRKFRQDLAGNPADADDPPDLIRKDIALHFGAFITESSGHLSEYLPYYRKREDLIGKYCRPGYDGESGFYANNWPKWRETKNAERLAMVRGEVEVKRPRSWEYASWIVEALEKDAPFRFHGNVPNSAPGGGGSLITNLPSDGCVEVACLVDGNGVQPTRYGKLPPQMAALCDSNMRMFDLGATAAIERSKEAAIHALMLDPLTSAVCSPAEIKAMTLELFEAEKEFLPDYR